MRRVTNPYFGIPALLPSQLRHSGIHRTLPPDRLLLDLVPGCLETAIRPALDMAYRDRPTCNWGALAATTLAVPATMAWTLIEMVGGALVCEGADGQCTSSGAMFILGLAVILALALTFGWLLNRAIEWTKTHR